jgi:hypothetical protein
MDSGIEENSLNEILTFQENFLTTTHIEEQNEFLNVNNILDSNHHMNIIDSINDFNDKINNYRIIEHKILVNDEHKKNIKNHILVHLENQIENIEQNFEKITHKQFDHMIDDETYKIKLSNELNELLGFSLEEYNQKSIKIEESINEICNQINNYFSELRNDIYNLHILNQKLQFISNYENESNENFFELIDKYENSIKNKLESGLKENIKKKIEKIHDLFNMLKLLQSQLYVKVVTKYSCGICLTNNIESYYNNCGHVICKSCGIKNRNSNICPFCKRENILKPLFFI